MTVFKSLWVVLAAGSVGFGQSYNISGIVTDTEATPIAGAVVLLEKAGLTAKTEADGSFTLVAGSAILPGNGKLLRNGFSASISNNRLTVTIAERSVMEVRTFDLSGKGLSTVRKTMEAGNQSIPLPCQGSGIFLYKVKSGNSEVVIMGNSVGGVSSGNAESSLATASNSMVAKGMDVTYDVMKITKEGYLNNRVGVKNADSIGMTIRLILQDAGTISDIDGNVYHTIRMWNQVWTVENLRVTRYNDGSSIPFITDNDAWRRIYDSSLNTPAYCYPNNTTNADSIKKFGALYNWYAVKTGNLAPAGWHVPDTTEWKILENNLIALGYNWDGSTYGNNLAKSMSAKTEWVCSTVPGTFGNDLTKNNTSGFSAQPAGSHRYDGPFEFIGEVAFFWSASAKEDYWAWYRWISGTMPLLGQAYNGKSIGCSVRLVKD